MIENNVTEENNLEKISIKSLFFQARDILIILWKGKYIIVIVSLLFGVTGYYLATNSFMVKEDESNSIGGLMSMMGNFGFGGNKTKMNLDKVIALANSNRIIKESLLDSAILGGNQNLIANSIIDTYNITKDLIKNDKNYNSYRGIVNPKRLTSQDNEVLKILLNLVNGEKNESKLLHIEYDKDNTIILLTITSVSEELSLNLCNAIYRNLSKFYIDQSIEKSVKTIKSLERRLNFVNQKLKIQEYNLKANQDVSLGLWSETAKLPAVKMTRDAGISSVLYSEIIKNLESTRFTLDNTIPIFQIIDQPEIPLTKQKPGILKYIFGFAMIGLALSSFMFYVIWSIRN